MFIIKVLLVVIFLLHIFWKKNAEVFLKVNSKSFAKMFEEEEKGLLAIENTNTIAVPHVHLVDELENLFC